MEEGKSKSEQSTGRLASYNILKECPSPSSYERRNIKSCECLVFIS